VALVVGAPTLARSYCSFPTHFEAIVVGHLHLPLV